MHKMKKIAISIVLALITFPVFCQESQDYPVRIFETSILVDNQTVATPFKGMLEFEIHHRFGTVNNALNDLFGLWAPANIRLGLNYGITDRLMVQWVQPRITRHRTSPSNLPYCSRLRQGLFLFPFHITEM